MRLRAKVDDNQKVIVEALRKAGRAVAITSTVGNGFPDLVVGFGGKNFLLEIKKTSKSKLTPDQLEFISFWRGQWARVETVEEAIKFTKE